MAGIFDTGIFDSGIFDHPATGTIASAVGAASGTGAATPVATTIVASVGSASGTGAASPTATAVSAAVGSASGTGATAPAATAIAGAVGTASSTSTATGRHVVSENIFLLSEVFYGSENGASLTSNAVSEPYSGSTAELITELVSASAVVHSVTRFDTAPYQTVIGTTGHHTISFFTKNVSGSRGLSVAFGFADSNLNGVTVEFYPGTSTAAANSSSPSGGLDLQNFGVESLSDGWYRVWAAPYLTAGTKLEAIYVYLLDETQSYTTSYEGQSGKSVAIGGFQINRGIGPATYSVGLPLIKEGVGTASGSATAHAIPAPILENRFPSSEYLYLPATYGITLAQNAINDPFGNPTAEVLTETTTYDYHYGGFELNEPWFDLGSFTSGYMTLSFYVKSTDGRNADLFFEFKDASNHSSLQFYVIWSATNHRIQRVGIVASDDGSLAVSTSFTDGSGWTNAAYPMGWEDVGNGWYRVWATAPITPLYDVAVTYFSADLVADSGDWLYTGTGKSAALWGIQINEGIGAADYTPSYEWGYGTASATGEAASAGTGIAASAASASGTGATSATGQTLALVSATVAATGAGAASGVGASTASSSAVATGTGAGTGTLASTSAASATSSGAGTSSGIGASTSNGVASASGTGAGSVTGSSTSVASSVATASATSTASAVAANQPVQENLYPSSEYIFANARSGIVVTQDAVTSPFGAQTAESFVEQTTGLAHYLTTYQPMVQAQSGISGPKDFTFSCYIKSTAASRMVDVFLLSDIIYLQLRFQNSTQKLVSVNYANPNGDQSNWNDSTYAATYGLTGGRTGFYTPFGCESVGNDWYRIWATIELDSSYLDNPSIQFDFIKDNGSSVSQTYTGNGTSSFSVWGIQINEGLGPAAYQANQQYAFGTASGTGTTSAVSTTTVAVSGDGSSTGTGASTGVGTALVPATGTATGSGAGDGAGANTSSTQATSTGSGVASAQGTGVNNTVGSASGSGNVAGSITATAEAAASALGTGTAIAVGTGVVSSVGTADGSGTSSITVSEQAAAIASADGLGTAAAAAIGISSSNASASASGSAGAVALATSSSLGTAYGTGLAAAVGTGVTVTTGSATGTGGSEVATSAAATTVGSASGTTTAVAIGTGIQAVVGYASGSGVGSAVQSAISAGTASATGSGAAHAAGLAVITGVQASSGTGEAFGVAERLLSLFPDSTLATGGWTTDTGDTDLAGAIDEGVPNDSDYIRSSTTPSNDACEIGFSAPQGNAGEEIIVEYRYGKNGAARVDLVVKLKQGPTEIAVWTHLDVPGEEVTVSHNLTSGEISDITNFADLSLEFIANEP